MRCQQKTGDGLAAGGEVAMLETGEPDIVENLDLPRFLFIKAKRLAQQLLLGIVQFGKFSDVLTHGVLSRTGRFCIWVVCVVLCRRVQREPQFQD